MYKHSRFNPADLQTGNELVCRVVCLTLLASFFLPSHLSLKHSFSSLIKTCASPLAMHTCTCAHIHVYLAVAAHTQLLLTRSTVFPESVGWCFVARRALTVVVQSHLTLPGRQFVNTAVHLCKQPELSKHSLFRDESIFLCFFSSTFLLYEACRNLMNLYMYIHVIAVSCMYLYTWKYMCIAH